MLQDRPWRGVNDIQGPPSFSGGSSPHMRFALPAARGKMSLNARDWWKGKVLLFKLYRLKFFRIPTNAHSPSFSLCPVWGAVSQEVSRSPWFRLSAPSTWQKGALPKLCGPQKRRMVPKRVPEWLLCLGLNARANLPLQPHFWLLPQLAPAASIPGRCGPVVWSQLSPSSSGPHCKSLFGVPLLAEPCYMHYAERVPENRLLNFSHTKNII